MTQYYFHPIADIFPLLEGQAFADFVDDIKQHGVREPVTLHPDGRILDGRNRYRACVQLGIEPPTRTWDGVGSPVAFVVSLNLMRRHLDESQRSMVGARIATLDKGRPAENTSIAVFKQADAASLLNVSVASIQRASAVLDHGTPELVSAVDAGTVRVSTAADLATAPPEHQRAVIARGEAEILREAKRIREERSRVNAEQRARVAATQPTLPDGRHDVLVIDPPWPMQKIDREVRPNQVGFDYPTMSEDELRALPVGEWCADNCHLFMWTTHRFLPLAFELLEVWGFRYVCTFVWHKPGGFQPIGLPQYNCEFAVYARRGSPAFIDTKQFWTCFEAPRREHSRKPGEFYATVKRVTVGRRLDVFSREAREGFSQHGNQTAHFHHES